MPNLPRRDVTQQQRLLKGASVAPSAFTATAEPPRQASASHTLQGSRPAVTSPNSALQRKPLAISTRVSSAGREGFKIEATQALGPAIASVEVRRTNPGSGQVINLKVAPQYRRQGIATQLIQAAVRNATQQGLVRLELEARPGDGSIVKPDLVSLYTRVGFRQYGVSVSGNPLMQNGVAPALPDTSPHQVNGHRVMQAKIGTPATLLAAMNRPAPVQSQRLPGLRPSPVRASASSTLQHKIAASGVLPPPVYRPGQLSLQRSSVPARFLPGGIHSPGSRVIQRAEAPMCTQCQQPNYSGGLVCSICVSKNKSAEKSGAKKTYTSNARGYEGTVKAAADATGDLQSKLSGLQLPPKKKSQITFASLAKEFGGTWQVIYDACKTIKRLKLKINAVTELFDLGESGATLGHAISTGTINEKEVGELYGAIQALCTGLVALIDDDQHKRLLSQIGMLETLKAWASSGKGCITSLAEDLLR